MKPFGYIPQCIVHLLFKIIICVMTHRRKVNTFGHVAAFGIIFVLSFWNSTFISPICGLPVANMHKWPRVTFLFFIYWNKINIHLCINHYWIFVKTNLGQLIQGFCQGKSLVFHSNMWIMYKSVKQIVIYSNQLHFFLHRGIARAGPTPVKILAPC